MIEATLPSTGELQKSDTTITIDIDLIRNANIKLIERMEFKNIIEQQNIIIGRQNQVIALKNEAIDKYIDKLNDAIAINNVLKEDVSKYKRVAYIAAPVCLTIGLILGIIIH